MRLFVGIPLQHEVIEQLSAVSAKLKSGQDRLRWTAPESWHITLQFLGSTNRETCDCVVARLREIRSAAVPVRLGDLNLFDRAGVFLAEIELTPELVALQQCVAAATGVCGFVAEARPYHPHITLARSKGEGRGRELRALKSRVGGMMTFSRFAAEEFVLYESFLEPSGARYEIRERFALIQGREKGARASLLDEP